MTYNIYMVMRDGQAEVSMYVGRTESESGAVVACTTLSVGLEHLEDCPVTELRAVDENFNCVYAERIERETQG